MTEFTLSSSAIHAKCPIMTEFLKFRDVEKFLNEISKNKDYKIEDGIVTFYGEQGKRKHDLNEPHKFTDFDPFLKPASFANRHGMPMYLDDMYAGASAFLICGGPSLNKVDLDLLRQPGILKIGVNNSASIVRPNIWTCVDPPDRFMKSVYYDPTIMKVMHTSAKRKMMFDSVTKRHVTERLVQDCPNVVYYERHDIFNSHTYLTEPAFCWGNSGTRSVICERTGKVQSGGKSCMLVAMKILIRLGVRNIFIIGADFSMNSSQPYAFEQEKSSGGSSSNNNTYRTLNIMFDQLRPEFEKQGINVYNTYQDSGLKSFDYVSYNDAIDFCMEGMTEIKEEKTKGMYSNAKKVEAKLFAGMHYKPDLQKLEAVKTTPALSVQSTAHRTEAFINEVTPAIFWSKREELISVYPDLQEVMNVCQNKIDLMEKQGKRCKGCTLNRMIQPFMLNVLQYAKQTPKPLEDAAIFDLDAIVKISNKRISMKDWIHGNS